MRRTRSQSDTLYELEFKGRTQAAIQQTSTPTRRDTSREELERNQPKQESPDTVRVSALIDTIFDQAVSEITFNIANKSENEIKIKMVVSSDDKSKIIKLVDKIPVFEGIRNSKINKNVEIFLSYIKDLHDSLEGVEQQNYFLSLIKLRMRGPALLLVQGQAFQTFKDFKSFIDAHYTKKESRTALWGKLTSLKQANTESIIEYSERLLDLQNKNKILLRENYSGKDTNMLEEELEAQTLSSFVRGVHSESIQNALFIKKPKTLKEAINEALELEQYIKIKAETSSGELSEMLKTLVNKVDSIALKQSEHENKNKKLLQTRVVNNQESRPQFPNNYNWNHSNYRPLPNGYRENQNGFQNYDRNYRKFGRQNTTYLRPNQPSFPSQQYQYPFQNQHFSNHPFSNQPFSSQCFSNQPFSTQPFSNQPLSNQSFSSQSFSNQPFSYQPFSNHTFSNHSLLNQPPFHNQRNLANHSNIANQQQSSSGLFNLSATTPSWYPNQTTVSQNINNPHINNTNLNLNSNSETVPTNQQNSGNVQAPKKNALFGCPRLLVASWVKKITVL